MAGCGVERESLDRLAPVDLDHIRESGFDDRFDAILFVPGSLSCYVLYDFEGRCVSGVKFERTSSSMRVTVAWPTAYACCSIAIKDSFEHNETGLSSLAAGRLFQKQHR